MQSKIAIRLRAMLPEDRKDLIDVLKATGVFQDYEIEVADEVLRDVWSPGSTYRCCCAVDEEDRVIGYVCWGATPCTSGTYDLYWIAVHPKVWGTGVGTRLLNAAEEDVKERKARLILIETSSVNDYEQTRKFYLRNGYKQLATVPDFYRPGDDKIIYGKYFVS